MAKQERKKEDLFIKPKRRAKNFFITSSAKMSDDKGVSKTAISSSVFTKMSQSFADGEYLLDDAIREPNASILYMLQEMQQDIDDVYNEVSASAFQSSFFPFARIDSGSFGVISSSLVPGLDSKYNLGAVGKEWNDLFIDGTANVDAINLNGTAISSTAAEINKLDGYTGDVNDLNYLKTLRATGVTNTEFDYLDGVTSNIQTQIDNAGGGGGGGSGNYDTGSNLIPHTNNTYDLGSKTNQWKNLFVDGVAYIDSIAGGTLTLPLAPPSSTLTTLKSSAVNVTGINVLILNSSTALSITGLIPLHPGQELTIMNIGSGAVTITRSQGGKARTIYGSGNITINQHQAYKFVCNPSQVWYQIS